MSDNKNMQDGRDRSKINVNETYELQYWREKFGVSSEALQEAVDKVGTSADKVEQYLKGKG